MSKKELLSSRRETRKKVLDWAKRNNPNLKELIWHSMKERDAVWLKKQYEERKE